MYEKLAGGIGFREQH